MKKNKVFSLLSVFFFVCFISLMFFVPASASEYTTVYMEPDYYYESIRAYVYNGEYIGLRSVAPSLVYTASYTLTAELFSSLVDNLNLYATYLSLSKSFKVSDAYDDANYPNNGFLIPIILVYEFDNVEQRVAPVLRIYDSYSNFQEAWTNEFLPVISNLVENGYSVTLIFQSLIPDPGIYLYSEDAPAEPIYYSAWNMLKSFIFGDDAELSPEQNLVMTLVSVLLVFAVVLVPLAIIWIVVVKIFNWW